MAYAVQPQQAAGYGAYQQRPGMPAALAASVAREVASGAGGISGTGANAPGVAAGKVDKKKKKKKKIGNAVSTRAMPAFKPARSTKDMWTPPSDAGINLF